MPIVTLTTDFGLGDTYVGQVKGVILGICPQAVLVDLTHLIPAQEVARAALALYSSYSFFPAGTIHLAVVDPGVGTLRRALAAKADGHVFVAPDNGTLTLVLQKHPDAEIRQITSPNHLRARISPTFHGRDIFAPAAGHLAAGLDMAELGPPVDDIVHLDLPRPRMKGGRIMGQVIHVDRFGNLITNITVDQILKSPRNSSPNFHLAGRELKGLHLTYAEVEAGQPLALVGSLDLVEIAINQGRADKFFEAGAGATVEVVL